MYEGPLGTCCDDLSTALTQVPNPLLRVEENGVLYLTVGYAQTAQGVGWFDQAVLFCPFCGAPLQDRETVRRLSGTG